MIECQIKATRGFETWPGFETKDLIFDLDSRSRADVDLQKKKNKIKMYV